MTNLEHVGDLDVGWEAGRSSRRATALLHMVSPTDAPSFLLAPVMFLVVAAAASFIPAIRARRVDPLVAPRTE